MLQYMPCTNDILTVLPLVAGQNDKGSNTEKELGRRKVRSVGIDKQEWDAHTVPEAPYNSCHWIHLPVAQYQYDLKQECFLSWPNRQHVVK